MHGWTDAKLCNCYFFLIFELFDDLASFLKICDLGTYNVSPSQRTVTLALFPFSLLMRSFSQT